MDRMVNKNSLQFSFCFEIFLQVLEHFFGRCSWCVTLNGLSILVDNELCEIPLDSIEQHSTLLLLQVLPQRWGGLAVDFNLLKQVKLDLVIAGEALNRLSISRLLVIELVTGESENPQTWQKEEINSVTIKFYTLHFMPLSLRGNSRQISNVKKHRQPNMKNKKNCGMKVLFADKLTVWLQPQEAFPYHLPRKPEFSNKKPRNFLTTKINETWNTKNYSLWKMNPI